MFLSKPQSESIKEAGRVVLLLVISWAITETLKQINVVPVTLDVHVWVFVYTIPVQTTLSILLTVVGRYIDKLIFEQTKAKSAYINNGEPKGLLPF